MLAFHDYSAHVLPPKMARGKQIFHHIRHKQERRELAPV